MQHCDSISFFFSFSLFFSRVVCIASSNASFCARLSSGIYGVQCGSITIAFHSSSSPSQSSQSSLTKISCARKKRLWMARNTADLRDEIMIRGPIPPQARTRWSYVASLFESLGFSANFLPSPQVAGNGESTVVHLPHQKLFSASSSLPFHVIVFA